MGGEAFDREPRPRGRGGGQTFERPSGCLVGTCSIDERSDHLRDRDARAVEKLEPQAACDPRPYGVGGGIGHHQSVANDGSGARRHRLSKSGAVGGRVGGSRRIVDELQRRGDEASGGTRWSASLEAHLNKGNLSERNGGLDGECPSGLHRGHHV